MKNKVKILICISLSLFSCRSNKGIVAELECDALGAMVQKIKLEEKTDSLFLANQFINWELGFELPKEYFPKTEEERQKKLLDDQDPYTMFYVFAEPATDSLIPIDEREFMKLTAKSSDTIALDCGIPWIIPFDRKVESWYSIADSSDYPIYAFFRPIFSKDRKKVVIRIYSNYRYYLNDKVNTGIMQTFFLARTKGGAWKEIYRSRKWL